jgi:hypothetical protein
MSSSPLFSLILPILFSPHRFKFGFIGEIELALGEVDASVDKTTTAASARTDAPKRPSADVGEFLFILLGLH